MFTSTNYISEKEDLLLNTDEINPILSDYIYKIDNLNHTINSILFDGTYNNNLGINLPLDINVGNYPNNIDDTDTNTGLSWKNYSGIPNIEIMGNICKNNMPIYPTEKELSFYDTIQILKLVFNITEINTNLDDGNDDILSNMGKIKRFTPNNFKDLHTVLLDNFENHNIYLSLSSTPLQWVKAYSLFVYVGEIDYDNQRVKNCKIKLMLDGNYICNQQIGNGTPNQKLLIWNEKSSITDIYSYTRLSSFKKSFYIEPQHLTLMDISYIDTTKNKLVINMSDNILEKLKKADYIYIKESEDIFKIHKWNIIESNNLIEIFVDHELTMFSPKKYIIQFVQKNELHLYKTNDYNLDILKDRYAIYLFCCFIKNKYFQNKRLPMTLLKEITHIDTTYINNLMYFEGILVDKRTDSVLKKIFQFIDTNENYIYPLNNQYKYYGGVAFKSLYNSINMRFIPHWERPSHLNTNLNIEYPEDWEKYTSQSDSGKITSFNTKKIENHYTNTLENIENKVITIRIMVV